MPSNVIVSLQRALRRLPYTRLTSTLSSPTPPPPLQTLEWLVWQWPRRSMTSLPWSSDSEANNWLLELNTVSGEKVTCSSIRKSGRCRGGKSFRWVLVGLIYRGYGVLFAETLTLCPLWVRWRPLLKAFYYILDQFFFFFLCVGHEGN